LDLSDPSVRIKLIDGYVDLLKLAETETRIMLEAGSLRPEAADLVRYQYLDAQVLQLQFRKQLEKK